MVAISSVIQGQLCVEGSHPERLKKAALPTAPSMTTPLCILKQRMLAKSAAWTCWQGLSGGFLRFFYLETQRP